MDKRTLSEKIAELIRKEIKSGILAQDERLPNESELMKQYKVGRSTVREAMKLLSYSGFVKIRQGVGTFVNTIDMQDKNFMLLKEVSAEDIAELRCCLAPSILLHYIGDVKNRPMIIDALQKYREAIDIGHPFLCYEADMTIRRVVTRSCSNKLLATLYTATLSEPEWIFFPDNNLPLSFWSMRYKKFEELCNLPKQDCSGADDSMVSLFAFLLE